MFVYDPLNLAIYKLFLPDFPDYNHRKSFRSEIKCNLIRSIVYEIFDLQGKWSAQVLKLDLYWPGFLKKKKKSILVILV